MNEKNILDIKNEGERLLALSYRVASEIFQAYTFEQQLSIIEATRDPKKREQLYYLVPDCTELIQNSKTEDVLQVLDTMLGTGLTCGLLPTLTGTQFEEIINLSLWKDGRPDEEMLTLWIGELAECDQDDLAKLLIQIDYKLVAYILQNRIDIPTEYKAMFIENGLIELEQIEFEDEASRFIMETIWLADPTMFIDVLREIFTEVEYEPERDEISLLEAEEEREAVIEDFDKERQIEISEDELFQEVDLNDLNLDFGYDEHEEEDEDV